MKEANQTMGWQRGVSRVSARFSQPLLRLLCFALLWSSLSTSALAYYNPTTGRWLNRDPMEERGGSNAYAILAEDCINRVDRLGLAPLPPPAYFDVTKIPGIMTVNGWTVGAALQKHWFSLPVIGPQQPETTIVKMKWVLGYPRAKSVYDGILNQKLYVNPAAVKEIKKAHGSKKGFFGDFSLPVPILDKESIQYRSVGALTDPLDDMYAGLGKFTLRVVVKGCVTRYTINITDIGIYVKDSFDFQGKQSLGYWNPATNYGGKNPLYGTEVTNDDYNFYSGWSWKGADFLVFSDLAQIKLSQPEIIPK